MDTNVRRMYRHLYRGMSGFRVVQREERGARARWAASRVNRGPSLDMIREYGATAVSIFGRAACAAVWPINDADRDVQRAGHFRAFAWNASRAAVHNVPMPPGVAEQEEFCCALRLATAHL